jgi:hypothetical protein
MKTAISKNGRVWPFANGALLHNMELAVRAIAQHPLALSAYNAPSRRENHHHHPEKLTTQQVQEHVETTLRLREAFLNQFLRGILSKKDNDNNHCYLHMLDQGQETGQAFKILIAQFLGIPMGEMLSIYNKCLRHLLSPPPYSYEIALSTSSRELLNRDDDLAEMDRLQRRQFILRHRRGIMRMQRVQQLQLQNPNLNDEINNNMNELFLRGADILDDDEDNEDEVVDFFHMLDDPAPMFHGRPRQGGGMDLEARPAAAAAAAAAENGLRVVGLGGRRPPLRAGDVGRRAMRDRLLAAMGPPPDPPGVNVGAPPIPGERRPRAVVEENLGRDDEVFEGGELQNGHPLWRPPRRPRMMMDRMMMMDDDVDDWMIENLEEDDLR